MDSQFDDSEKLYRAVLEMYCDGDIISPAAFRDKRGLSVYRGYGRPDAEVVDTMRGKLKGRVIVLTVKNCRDVGAEVLYAPSRDNAYHSEIHGGTDNQYKIILNAEQRDYLANVAVTIDML